MLKVVGRDDIGADWLYRAWRLLVFRRDDERQRPRDPRELAEHEAYLLLLARQGGVEVPRLVGTRLVGEEHAVVVRESIAGTPLDELPMDDAAKRVIVGAWQQLHRLHAAGITCGSPTLDACVAIAERHSVEVAARCAAAALDHDGVVALLGQLQPLSLSARTRRVARRGRLLIPLRSQLGQLVGAEPAAIASPTRVAVRNLLPLLGALLAVNLLLPQVGHAQATLDALRQARWTWLLALGAAATATYIAAAVSLMGAVGRRLELGRTTAAQLAAAFTNRLTPAGLGGMSTNVMYLRAAGRSRAEAITAVGLNSIAGFLVHLVGVAAIVPLLGAGHARLRFSGPELPDRWPWLLVSVVALALIGVWHWWALVRRCVGSAGEAMFGAMRAAVRRPRPALVLLAGAAGITTAYTLALGAACQAFSVGLPLATVTAVFLGGSAAAAVAPTPGGLGALEAALVAGLTAAGASSGPAIAAVLTYRLVTYWLPVLPGAVSFHFLSRSGWL
jgi:undecaprenyl-diphosphatase